MKKLIAALTALASTAMIFAGGIENKSNMSTGYLRNPSRNVESERPEAAFYNIAGTAFMEDGLYIEAGDQFIVKEYANTLKSTDTKFNDETFVYLYPNADIVYKHGPFAVFANFGIYAGGGTLEYSEGTAATYGLFAGYAAAYAALYPTTAAAFMNVANNHSITVTSITYGEQVGFAWNFGDMLSAAAAVRFLQGTQDFSLTSDGLAAVGNGGDEISYSAEAFGVSPVFGIHAKPMAGLDIAFQYQCATKLNYELSDVKGTLASNLGITNGAEFRTDLAHVFNLGAGYQVNEPLFVSTSLNYYLNDLDSVKMNSILGECEYDNSFEIALGGDYKFNDMVLASLGFAYGKQGVDEENNNIFNPVLDSFQIGAGAEVTPIENLTLTAGATWVKYFSEDYSDGAIELSKDVLMFSIGGTYKFDL